MTTILEIHFELVAPGGRTTLSKTRKSWIASASGQNRSRITLTTTEHTDHTEEGTDHGKSEEEAEELFPKLDSTRVFLCFISSFSISRVVR